MINKNILSVLLFNIAYMGFAFFVVFSRSNMEFLIYMGVVIVALFVIMHLHKRFVLPIGVLWTMSFWGLFHMSGGLLLIPESWPVPLGKEHVLYNLWLIEDVFKYDQAVHAYGFGMTTWLIWEILRKTIAVKTITAVEKIQPTFGLLFLCVIASMGLGALNEVIEFVAVLSVPETNVGGYINTGWDLVFNMAGAMLVAILIFCMSPSKPSHNT